MCVCKVFPKYVNHQTITMKYIEIHNLKIKICHVRNHPESLNISLHEALATPLQEHWNHWNNVYNL